MCIRPLSNFSCKKTKQNSWVIVFKWLQIRMEKDSPPRTKLATVTKSTCTRKSIILMERTPHHPDPTTRLKQTLKISLQSQSEAGLVFGKKKKRIVGGNWKTLPHLSFHCCYHCCSCFKPAANREPARLKFVAFWKPCDMKLIKTQECKPARKLRGYARAPPTPPPSWND